MPVVSKQNSTGPVKKSSTGSILNRATPVVNHESGGLHISLYGRGKTGKTRFACTGPKPLLIIGAEDGTKSVAKTKGVDFFLLSHSDEIKQILTDPLLERYKTIVLDTASRLQDLILCEVLGWKELPAQGSWGMASRQQFGEMALRTKTILREILNFPGHVIITAHERNFKDEEGEASELLFPSVGSALSPSVSGWLNGAVDYIFQTFVRAQVASSTQTIAGKQITSEKKTGKYEFCLRMGVHSIFLTGCRMADGSPPDVVVNATFDQVYQIVTGQKP